MVNKCLFFQVYQGSDLLKLSLLNHTKELVNSLEQTAQLNINSS